MLKAFPATETHDALFKALASSQHAAALLRDHLPAEIAALLDEEPPRRMSDDYQDKALRSTHSDLLLEVQLKAGGKALILIEHKSRPDSGTPLQLLGYVDGILKRYRQGKTGQRGALPPVIPLVFYHGAAKWSAPLSLTGMMSGGESLRGFTDLRYILRDFAAIPLAELSSAPMQRFGFVALYYATRKPRGKAEVEATLRTLLTEWWPKARDSRDEELQEQIFAYMIAQFNIDSATLTELAEAAQPNIGGKFMASLAQQLRAEGRTAGLAEGRTAGLAEGRAESLSRLLQRRFGPLPPTVQSRIAEATLDELGNWIDQVLDTPSLEAMFGDMTRH